MPSYLFYGVYVIPTGFHNEKNEWANGDAPFLKAVCTDRAIAMMYRNLLLVTQKECQEGVEIIIQPFCDENDVIKAICDELGLSPSKITYEFEYNRDYRYGLCNGLNNKDIPNLEKLVFLKDVLYDRNKVKFI